MSHEMVVAMHVTDDDAYTRYRAAMMPILASYGGGFRYDFKVGETLRAEAGHPVNRVFTIHFADRPSMDRFFSDPAYLEAKRAFFEGAVAHTTIVAAYDR